MDRRSFFRVSGLSAALVAAGGSIPGRALLAKTRRKSHFSILQISSVTDTIGNSYLLRTSGGKVIMIDGGFESEAENLRSKIAAAGNHVDLWFLTHPHQDHMGAFSVILADRRGITVDKVIYSRVPDSFLDYEKANAEDARRYYRILDSVTEATDIIDLHRTGQRFDIDGIGIMVLGVSNPDIRSHAYNDQSMIIRFWDSEKSLVILGDAGSECGNICLSKYPEELDCDYLQVSHHGQNGCDEHFYRTVSFRACLWPTPSWVWEPENPSLTTRTTRRWMDEKGITEHHPSCIEKDWLLK